MSPWRVPLPEASRPCYYCGLIADTIDHAVPQTVLARDVDGGHAGSNIKRLVVPACRECNSLLGALVFDTLYERKQYIKRRLRERYAAVLRMPAWTAAEMAELGPLLGSHVRARLALQRITRERIAW